MQMTVGELRSDLTVAARGYFQFQDAYSVPCWHPDYDGYLWHCD